MPMVWKKTGLVFGARWRRSSSSPKQAGIRLETKPTDADRRRVWDAAQKKLKSLDDLGVEDLSNFIAILLFTTMMFNNVFNAVKSIIKLVLTTKSRLPSPSAAITLEFFRNHVMVLLWQQMEMQGIVQSIVADKRTWYIRGGFKSSAEQGITGCQQFLPPQKRSVPCRHWWRNSWSKEKCKCWAVQEGM